ncbi:MAG: hypothetical protein HW380_969 [Magnetococcales bacterium]|nr:hypothetical protein [Magnetococcales bacterium]
MIKTRVAIAGVKVGDHPPRLGFGAVPQDFGSCPKGIMFMVETFLTRLFGVLLGLFFLVVMHVPVAGIGGGSTVPVACQFHWLVLATMILVGVLRVAHRGVLVVPSYLKYFLLFIFLVLLASLFQPPVSQHAFVFQTAGLVGGLLFFVALHQFIFNEQQRRWVLLVLLIASVLQAGIGLSQISSVTADVGIFGTMEHKNVLATFLATGLVIALRFMLEHPSRRVGDIILFMVVALSMTALVMASSRVGVVGLVLGCLTLAVAWREEFGKVWKRVLTVWGLALVVVIVAIVATQQQRRVQIVVDKVAAAPGFVTETLAVGGDKSYKLGRPLHFEIAWALFLERPFWGQGVGGFSSGFSRVLRDRYPDLTLSNDYHAYQPYNELLRRLAESGVGAGMGLLVMVGAMLVTLWRLGRREGGLGLALMIPIVFYLQVGGLFYDTVVLWATLLLLASFSTAHTVNAVKIPQHVGIRAGLGVLGTGLFVGMALFFINTAMAQRDMTRYMQLLSATRVSRGELLQPALDNFYLRETATRLFMDVRLRIAILRQDRAALREFLQWSKKEREKWPNHVMYLNESRALHAYGDLEAARTLSAEGLRLFPESEISRLRKELHLE